VRRSTASPIAVWAGLLVLYLAWGSTYLGIKIAMDSVGPFVMGSLRFIPAGLALTTIIAVRHRRTIRRPGPAQVRDSAIVAAFLLLGGTGITVAVVLIVTARGRASAAEPREAAGAGKPIVPM
jgi:drug/metabolite transporter (DMT)-like permease